VTADLGARARPYVLLHLDPLLAEKVHSYTRRL
jgi:hypothetical protein